MQQTNANPFHKNRVQVSPNILKLLLFTAVPQSAEFKEQMLIAQRFRGGDITVGKHNGSDGDLFKTFARIAKLKNTYYL